MVVQDSGSYWNYSDDDGVYVTARMKNDEASEQGYGPNHASSDLREVREREGIPDLEEETETGSEGYREDLLRKKEKDKAKQSSREHLNEKLWSPNLNPSLKDPREVVAEIMKEFEMASGYGKDVELMLRVILSQMLHLMLPFSKFTGYLPRSCFEDVGEGVDATVYSLSSTMDKLYAWEKKLYEEGEERLRVKYEKKYKRLRILDEEGAEPCKIYAAQTSIRRLRTKLVIRMKAIDAISSTVNKLRDEELQPKVAELIHGLIKMWKAMLKCHQKQYQAIMELKMRKHKPKTGLQSDTGSTGLEKELLAWCRHFENWIGFQKLYAESLNGWLLNCLQHETRAIFYKPDDLYSPGQLGAPTIFIICNDWQKALGCISEGGLSKVIGMLIGRDDEEAHENV
ncbi:Protein of unknown function (DUF630 and DUF632 [Striga hermonthica]|uniref:DUF632 domain-containing protein n=1 Tax=Striga hermonthica TaxID=68872 RepID=A0A9N7NQL7_STRHE|nr:Protein of unknown function (DUF630 and DUF632 [Striga hermonthica]